MTRSTRFGKRASSQAARVQVPPQTPDESVGQVREEGRWSARLRRQASRADKFRGRAFAILATTPSKQRAAWELLKIGRLDLPRQSIPAARQRAVCDESSAPSRPSSRRKQILVIGLSVDQERLLGLR